MSFLESDKFMLTDLVFASRRTFCLMTVGNDILSHDGWK